MDLRNFLQLLRDHWLLIGAVTALAVVGSAIMTARITPQYASSVTFYVSSQANVSNDPVGAYEGALFSQQEAQSYADLLDGPLVAAAVVRQLRLTVPAAKVSG